MATRQASRRSRRSLTITPSRQCTSISPISSARATSSAPTTRVVGSSWCRPRFCPARCRFPSSARVAAGLPIEAIQLPESIGVPEDLVRRGGNHYVLRVRGNSMIDEQIRDGDFVIVNEKQHAPTTARW